MMTRKSWYLIWVGFFGLIIWWFRHAFKIHFFQDDYWFLEISRIGTFSEFINFFSPIRDYSYKPLATEVFYLIIHSLEYNTIFSHGIMFISFMIGLIFLYKVIVLLTKNKYWAGISAGLYALHFTHVFQLYWFATYQEIAVLMFLTVSLYLMLTKKPIGGLIAFGLALLCKETAALYPALLVLLKLTTGKKHLSWKMIGLSGLLSVGFYLVCKYSLDRVTALENYRMVLSPKLIANNLIWYFLWGLGLPNIMPLYMNSLFSQPIPDFWKLFGIVEFRRYMISFGVFILGMAYVWWRNRKNSLKLAIWCLVSFVIFLGPILLFPHRWMVRLTLPLIFVSVFLAYILQKSFHRAIFDKYLTGVILVLYGLFNYFGVLFHESSGLIMSENEIFLKTQAYFTAHGKEISIYPSLFLYDEPYKRGITSINSERLKNSFHDQSFVDYFLPGSNLKVYYHFESEVIPDNTYILNTDEILK